jgi:hypothetical protein
VASAIPSIQALRQATRTVPIVFANVGDPAGMGATTCACVESRRRDRLKGTPSQRKTGRSASAQTRRGRDAWRQ